MYDIIVIGGGAAGMLAAAVSAELGVSVLLLEQNDRLGKKLRITGKGRCNLTNNCTVREILDNIPTGGRFLQSTLNGFTAQDTMALFRTLGVPLKTERGNRVFPESDKSSDIVGALCRYMDKTGVKQRRTEAVELLIANGAVTGVKTRDGETGAGAVILCTGGISYPATGSAGGGHKMAEAAGHTVTPLRGSLVPLEAEPETCSRMQGLALKNVSLTVLVNEKKPVFEDFGELLFTHFGISGPLALSASAHMRDFEKQKYRVAIDLKPALDEKKLDLRILRDFDKYSNRNFINSLGELLNRLMVPVIVERSGIEPDTKVHSITREQRMTLLRQIKGFKLEINRPRPVAEAIITSGGVDTREINPKTMESKLISGLYFAGEIIDADAYTGGFNLQIAWSTAFAAGTYAAQKILAAQGT